MAVSLKPQISRWFALAMLSGVGLAGCEVNGVFDRAQSQQIYQNERFGYAVPYPMGWVEKAAPTNRDGQVFVNPENPAIAIQAWASSNLDSTLSTPSASKTSNDPLLPLTNFETQQGIPGHLQVSIGQEVSILTLTLAQGASRYSLQAQSPNEEFASYYELFHSIARQYRIQRPRPSAAGI